ncbi:hypothetical protein [Streptomyces sp. NPDC020377]|uniref:hypothetical protein n=1 Tax=Streptomyces sp. NPDC020377 TaxID=3365070 RepID=UPI0037B7AF93
MSPERAHKTPARRSVEVHQPTPITPVTPYAAPLVPVQTGAVPAVTSVVLPDGRAVTGYAVCLMQPEPVATRPAVSRTAVNVALGGVGFLAMCGGLLLLTTFVTRLTTLTALTAQLIILAAVIFGGWIAVQIFGTHHTSGGHTFHSRKVTLGRNKFE